jgi:anti-sigma B factor antagonist
MELRQSELENGIRLIQLSGTLDMNGTYSIEVQFVRACEGDHVRVIVDLTKVSYISSVGIPMLVNAAKSVAARGGKMVLLNPQNAVADVLELTGITEVIPIYKDIDSAKVGVTPE